MDGDNAAIQTSRTFPAPLPLALALGASLIFFPASGAAADDDSEAPADLRIEWLLDGEPRSVAPPLRGKVGETLRVPYQVRNVGGSDTFAAVLSARTALGQVRSAERIAPGPQPGEAMPRTLALPLAEGMRELCLEVRLQNRRADDPLDPNPEDNRICRRVELERSETLAHLLQAVPDRGAIAADALLVEAR